MVYRPHLSVGHTLQNLINFTNILVLEILNPSFCLNALGTDSLFHDQHAHMLISV